MKIIDCITFFDNNFIFDVRYNILKDFVDYFVICESNFNHKGLEKKRNFILKDNYDQNKIKYLFLNKPFPKNNNPWKNQAIQREYILENLNFADAEDYIFFSDPDEIPNPEILSNFSLKKKYGIFLQKVFSSTSLGQYVLSSLFTQGRLHLPHSFLVKLFFTVVPWVQKEDNLWS